ncbi:MAG: DUF2157 domain-containing protein [Verrucomicrobiota bacterium]|nr:DUF2157 domain-containing protein [Verrucomicrobiota bacterium]MEC8906638.1 DUF2157 domain-containing protein [Verrucomicrobiota bacterium]
MSTLRDIVGSDEPTTVDNLPADRPLVDLLFARGVIDKAARRNAFNLLYPRTSTRELVLRTILGAAGAFFVFGFIMVIAANWQDLGKMLRLWIPQIVMIGCAAGMWRKGLGTLPGKFFAFGVVLGIEGVLVIMSQIYQLDADSVWFFRRLVLFPLPVVLLARFLPLWVAWIFLFTIYLGIEADQWDRGYFGEPSLAINSIALFIFLSVLVFITRVTEGRPSWDWVRASWFRFVLVLFTLIYSVIHLCMVYGTLIYGHGMDGILDNYLMIMEFCLIGSGIWYFSRKATDLWSLSLFVLAVDVVILVCGMITLKPDGDAIPVIGFVMSVGIFWGSFVLLNRFRVRLRDGVEKDEEEVTISHG